MSESQAAMHGAKRFSGGRIALRYSVPKIDDVAVHYLRCRDVWSSAFRIWIPAHREQRLAYSVQVQSKRIKRDVHDLRFHRPAV